jgi:hypothetical protein
MNLRESKGYMELTSEESFDKEFNLEEAIYWEEWDKEE